MKFFLSKFFVLVILAAALAAACQIENLPVNSNNVNANLSPSPASSRALASNQRVAENANGALVQTPPGAPTESNAAQPPFNSGAASANANPEVIVVSKLLIPVEGVKKENLHDMFAEDRSGGRTHNALDIMAPAGTPVFAAADGKLVKFHDSELGGITIYQKSSEDERLVLYYAHLQRRADGIAENMDVKRGTVIGYVGDTGNAGAGNYHLHFAMWIVDDPKRYWDGTNVNPYQYLK